MGEIDDKVDILNGLIHSYKQNKESLENYKKITEEQNTRIKELMREGNLSEYTTLDGLVAKITTQHRDSFKEDKLLLKLKELGFTSPIKTVEVIDYGELENIIYTGQLDATQLTSCKESKEVITLKVTRKKGE